MAERRRIGGQAIVDGVMIRGNESWAVAVRRGDGSLATHRESTPGWVTAPRQIPVLRGVVALAATLILGLRAARCGRRLAHTDRRDDRRAGVRAATAFAIVVVIGLFAVLPAVAARLIADRYLVAVAVEGLVRVVLLVGYIWAIGHLPGIRTVFEYHGAEHKVIAAYEAAEVEDIARIQAFSRRHARCGTDFLVLVGLVSVVVYGAVGRQTFPALVASRVVLLPLVAGLAFEGLRLADRRVRPGRGPLLLAPGLALQRLTTRQPSDEQVVVALLALRTALR